MTSDKAKTRYPKEKQTNETQTNIKQTNNKKYNLVVIRRLVCGNNGKKQTVILQLIKVFIYIYIVAYMR